MTKNRCQEQLYATPALNKLGEDIDVLGAIRNAVGDRAHGLYDASITLTDENAATIGGFLADIGRTLVRRAVPGLARGALSAPQVGRWNGQTGRKEAT
jgi:hypothetical protein